MTYCCCWWWQLWWWSWSRWCSYTGSVIVLSACGCSADPRCHHRHRTLLQVEPRQICGQSWGGGGTSECNIKRLFLDPLLHYITWCTLHYSVYIFTSALMWCIMVWQCYLACVFYFFTSCTLHLCSLNTYHDRNLFYPNSSVGSY